MPIINQVLAKCKTSFKSIYVVIDALDEYSDDADSWAPFIQALRNGNSDLRIFVTARPIVSIERALNAKLKVEMLAHHADVQAYIRARLGWGGFQKHGATDESLRTHIEHQVLKRSQGMYVLAWSRLLRRC
jgi:hypothetical protein